MPWVRFDDQFPINRKIAGLSDAAYRFHSSAIFWCARNLTDGFVAAEDVRDVMQSRCRSRAKLVHECCTRGVWHDAKEDCPSEQCPAPVDDSYPQGWVIHDYWEYQPSKAQVTRDRKATAQRQKRWRDRHGNEESPPGGGSRNGVTGVDSNGVSHGVNNAAPSRPVTTNGSVVSRGTGQARARDLNPYRSNDTAASRHPSARPPDVAAREAGIQPGQRPADERAIAAIAAKARQAINRAEP